MRFVVTDNKRAGDWGAVYIAKKIKEFNPSPEKKFVLFEGIFCKFIISAILQDKTQTCI